MKFSHSTLRVKDLEASIKFYEDILGLEVVNRFHADPKMEIAFLGCGETKVELICDGEERETDIGSDISWGFEVDMLDKYLALFEERGISIESGVIQPSPHVRFFFIKDPDGMKVQLLEHID